MTIALASLLVYYTTGMAVLALRLASKGSNWTELWNFLYYTDVGDEEDIELQKWSRENQPIRYTMTCIVAVFSTVTIWPFLMGVIAAKKFR